MADVAQLVRALVCGTRCREFESHLPPQSKKALFYEALFSLNNTLYEYSVVLCKIKRFMLCYFFIRIQFH